MSLYFKNETAELIFSLLELDGERRMKRLGITKIHYYRKGVADKWYADILEKLSDFEDIDLLMKAREKAKDLYSNMVDY